MPTPFMHLHATQNFLGDAAIPAALRHTLSQTETLGAFLLGHVAPDARVSSGLRREQTHFFDYTPVIAPPTPALFAAYPALKMAQGAHKAFVAGYLAHLAMDVVWAEQVLYPYFYKGTWADSATKFIMLHVLLCYLDERDYQRLPLSYSAALAGACPQDWLAFLPDADLAAWRDLVAGQIGQASQTLAIMGQRVTVGAEGLQAILSDPARLQAELWAHVPLAAIAEVETAMYAALCREVQAYYARES